MDIFKRLLPKKVNKPNLENFCEGVKILIARTESNPEDFDRGGKFSKLNEPAQLLKTMYPVLTNEEVKYLADKIYEANRANFTAKVVRAVTGDTRFDSLNMYEDKNMSLYTASARAMQAHMQAQMQNLTLTAGQTSNDQYSSQTPYQYPMQYPKHP